MQDTSGFEVFHFVECVDPVQDFDFFAATVFSGDGRVRFILGVSSMPVRPRMSSVPLPVRLRLWDQTRHHGQILSGCIEIELADDVFAAN